MSFLYPNEYYAIVGNQYKNKITFYTKYREIAKIHTYSYTIKNNILAGDIERLLYCINNEIKLRLMVYFDVHYASVFGSEIFYWDKYKRRVLPFIFKAAKPAAKQFVSSVVKDTIKGKKPLKQSLIKHGIKALKDTGLNLLSGSGKIMKKRRKRRRKYKGRITSKYLTMNKRKKNSNNRKTRRRYKNDIFSTI